MAKKDFIEKLADATGTTKVDAQKIYETMFDLIKSFVTEEGKLNVSKFGTFRLKERKARTARNPRTGEAVQVKASRSIAFKASPAVKGAI
jgi:DNA-binding protein HU-beta